LEIDARLNHNLFGILRILVLCYELYRHLRGYWIRQLLKEKKEGKQLREPRVMKPKSERDFLWCQKEKGKLSLRTSEKPEVWSNRKRTLSLEQRKPGAVAKWSLASHMGNH
jgi:hypothetical protein